MKNFLRSRDGASKGAALMIVLALVVLLTGLALAYMSRTTTDRQLAQSSYNDTSADLLARTALDIVVNDFKQEILTAGTTVTRVNIQPQRSGDDSSIPNLIRRSIRNDPIPPPGVSSLASAVSSTPDPANLKHGDVTAARWNSHYLIPPANNTDSTPVSSFAAPDWVLVTRTGPVAFSAWQNSLKDTTSNNYVVGRYAFAVYDEGGLLDMSLAGYPSWSGAPSLACSPAPTPWLVNVGRKGIMAFADLTMLPNSTASPAPTFPPAQVDNIVGWRNYAMTQRTFTGFPTATPGFAGETDCTKQDFYGSYLLNFGDPPFIIDSLSDKLLASIYPFTAAANYVSNNRTDQSLMTRQELLRLQRSLGFSQNVLQYMGTFSRERNRPAPDWPGLAGRLSEGRFNMNNLALVLPNPAECVIAHGKKSGWQTGKNKNHLCGDSEDVHRLFGLFWVRADIVGGLHPTGEWRYIGNRNPLPGPTASPAPVPLACATPSKQNDFFQILDYALFQAVCETDPNHVDKTFSIGASLIDQYDSGEACPSQGQNNGQPPGCDLDWRAVGSNWNKQANATHTTKILYANGNNLAAYGMEPNYSAGDPNAKVNGDVPYDPTYAGSNPHRPQNAPDPIAGQTQVISHAFATVGEFGYGINTSDATLPTLKFWDSTAPPFQYAPVLDFFSYNPISSAYPRAGIVNLYTRNAPVIAAMLKSTLKNDTLTSPPAAGVVSQAEAMNAANAIVSATQSLLAGTAIPAVQQTDLTRAIAGRLANVGSNAAGWTSDEQKESIARSLAEMGQTRTWNLLIDVIAQTGHYGPNAQGLTDFIPEGEKRYWLHIALGRDLVHADGTPCTDGIGCQVDVLGAQLEEVIE